MIMTTHKSPSDTAEQSRVSNRVGAKNFCLRWTGPDGG